MASNTMRHRNQGGDPLDKQGKNVSEKDAEPISDKYSNKNSGSEGSSPTLASPTEKPLSSQDPRTLTVFYIITALSFLTRLYRLHEPAEVVFDEVHFGKFASFYLRREYFFDVHPPLGKLLLAFVGYVCGYNGNFLFDKIGLKYHEVDAPYLMMRLFVALCGVAIVPMCFLILTDLKVSLIGAIFASALLLFDTALITQSRFILLDSMLLSTIVLSCFAWIRFYQQRYQPFSKLWWQYLILTGLGIGITFSIKLVGLFIISLIGLFTIQDLWRLIDYRRKLTHFQVLQHFFARVLCLIVLPLSIYVGSYYAHFAILTHSGPGDAFMSAAFQSTLLGNKMHGASQPVYYGSKVTIRSQLETMYLHSHLARYPLHIEKKVSSAGQQVTGYSHDDVNNEWRFVPESESDVISQRLSKDATVESLKDLEQRPIQNGDILRVLHVTTDCWLLTHDVASPNTMTNQEVTCMDRVNATRRYQDTLFKMEILSGCHQLKSKGCPFRLVHVPTQVAINLYAKTLPAWGFNQREINGLKVRDDATTHWVVESHISPFGNGQESPESETPNLSFLSKFLELQAVTVRQNSGLKDNHPYASEPFEWPFVLRGISFWQDENKSSQVYFLGNILAWYIGLGSVFSSLFLLVAEWILRRRGYQRLDDVTFQKLEKGGGFLLLAYAFHYLPFYSMSRVLFLHHYLPAFIFSCMNAGLLVDILFRPGRSVSFLKGLFVLLLSLAVMGVFVLFAPFSYGLPLTGDQVKSRKWFPGWDLHVNK